MSASNTVRRAAALALLPLLGVAAGLVSLCAQAATPVHQCVIHGTVSFQSAPCPPDGPVRRPTVDALNAERRKRLADPAHQAASAQQVTSAPRAMRAAAPAARRAADPAPAPSARHDAGFRCDGRQHCSQMRSCSEAKFFLAQCPDTKMDGDRDGLPCEDQWCTGPVAR